MYTFGYLVPDNDFAFDEFYDHDHAGRLRVITGSGLEVSGTIWEPVIHQHKLSGSRRDQLDLLERVADEIWDEAQELSRQSHREHPTGARATLTHMFTVKDSLSGADDELMIVNELMAKAAAEEQPVGCDAEEFIRSVQIAADSRPAPAVRPGAVQLDDGRSYVPRRINGNRDLDFLRSARERNLIIQLNGAPGTGKTTMNEAAFGADLITVNCFATMTVADLVGQYLPVPNQPGAFTWVDGPLVEAMLEGRPLLLDDASNMPPEVQNFLLPVADHRRAVTVLDRLEEPHITAADGFWLCLAQNPGTGFGISEPLSDRVAAIVDVAMDLSIARDLGCDPQILSIAKKLENRRVQDPNRVLEHWTPGFRVLMDATEVGAAFGVQTGATAMRSACPSRDKALLEFLDGVFIDEFGENLPTLLTAEV